MRLLFLFEATILSSLLAAQLAWSEPLLTVTCEPPRGRRVDYGQGAFGTEKTKLEEGTDSFTGVNPVFIIDGGTPDQVTVIWGDSKGIPKAMQLPTKAQQPPIVHFSAGQITAVYNYGNGVWVYSLFPKLAFGVFTRQSHLGPEGHHATGSMLYAKCQFAYSKDRKKQ